MGGVLADDRDKVRRPILVLGRSCCSSSLKLTRRLARSGRMPMLPPERVLSLSTTGKSADPSTRRRTLAADSSADSTPNSPGSPSPLTSRWTDRARLIIVGVWTLAVLAAGNGRDSGLRPLFAGFVAMPEIGRISGAAREADDSGCSPVIVDIEVPGRDPGNGRGFS